MLLLRWKIEWIKKLCKNSSELKLEGTWKYNWIHENLKAVCVYSVISERVMMSLVKNKTLRMSWSLWEKLAVWVTAVRSSETEWKQVLHGLHTRPCKVELSFPFSELCKYRLLDQTVPTVYTHGHIHSCFPCSQDTQVLIHVHTHMDTMAFL